MFLSATGAFVALHFNWLRVILFCPSDGEVQCTF